VFRKINVLSVRKGINFSNKNVKKLLLIIILKEVVLFVKMIAFCAILKKNNAKNVYLVNIYLKIHALSFALKDFTRILVNALNAQIYAKNARLKLIDVFSVNLDTFFMNRNAI
jgi:hypothetical protein